MSCSLDLSIPGSPLGLLGSSPLLDTSSHTEPDAQASPAIGRTLAGKYRLDHVLGEGGMGTVYRARQLALDKDIAVKVLHKTLAEDPLFTARFHREALAASKLDHENSIRIFDFGEEPDGLLYIAMELVVGSDLWSSISPDVPLAPEVVADVVSQTLSALAVAHGRGIIHRDLKPENIMVVRARQDGEDQPLIKVCDFGIAKLREVPEPEAAVPSRAVRGHLTAAGLVMGTPEYMSPEQGRGEPLDPRSDLYSVGVILYLLLTGRVPFESDSPVATVLMHQNDHPVAPSMVRADVHPGLEAVCLKALRKKPAERFASAKEMRAALRSAMRDAARPALSSGAALPAAAQVPSDARTLPLMDRYVPGGDEPVDAAPVSRRPPSEATPAASRTRRRWPAFAAAGAAGLAALASALAGARLPGASAAVSTEAPNQSLAPAADAEVAEVFFRAVVTPTEPEEPSDTAAPSAGPAASPSHAGGGRVPGGVRHADAVTIAGPSASSASPHAAAVPASTVPEAPALPVEAKPAGPPPEALPTLPPPGSTDTASPERPPPFDRSAARVTAGPASVVWGGGHAREINAIVRSALPRIAACYRDVATPASPEGTYKLSIASSDTGEVDQVSLDAPLSDEAKRCITGSIRGTVRADTGPVTATVMLTFRLR